MELEEDDKDVNYGKIVKSEADTTRDTSMQPQPK